MSAAIIRVVRPASYAWPLLPLLAVGALLVLCVAIASIPFEWMAARRWAKSQSSEFLLATLDQWLNRYYQSEAHQFSPSQLRIAHLRIKPVLAELTERGLVTRSPNFEQSQEFTHA